MNVESDWVLEAESKVDDISLGDDDDVAGSGAGFGRLAISGFDGFPGARRTQIQRRVNERRSAIGGCEGVGVGVGEEEEGVRGLGGRGRER